MKLLRFTWIFEILYVTLITGCADNTLRMYNHENEEDKLCYGKLGGGSGYCDKPQKGSIK